MVLSSFLIVLLLILSLCNASTVKVEIQRNDAVRDAQLRKRATKNDYQKRDEYVQVLLSNSLTEYIYFAEVTVGTPPQKLSLQIDTGSSDTWVPSSSATDLNGIETLAFPNGSFSTPDSSTYTSFDTEIFNITYQDDTSAFGHYFQDTFSIDDTTLTDFKMGLANQTSINIGIIGIGFNSSEQSTNIENGGDGMIYENLPYALVTQGQVKSVAYSLWLNDLESSTGSILFGGVDTEKYVGDLKSVKLYPNSRGSAITTFSVALTSLSATSKTGTDVLTPPGYAVPVILDSGTALTYLPDDIAALIFEELGATYNETLEVNFVPCDLAHNTGNLSYGIGGSDGPTINVAVSDLVLPPEDVKNPNLNEDGRALCDLGIRPGGSEPLLFGDTFLRSAYVVYDLVNNRAALAETKFNVSKSNIVPFSSFGASIPRSKEVSNDVELNPQDNTTNSSPTTLLARPGFLSNPTTKPDPGSIINRNSTGQASFRLDTLKWTWAVISSSLVLTALVA